MIRVSGPDAAGIVQRCWRGADLTRVASHSAHLGTLLDSDGSVLDQAVATVFRAPKSFTGENVVELSVHGSKWIQKRVIDRLIGAGARIAEPGEFTRRAFINGRIDLAQAEAVADVIASSSRAAHRLAMSQLSGGFSKRLNELREKLIELASLLELELDFSEEEVEFADRQRLRTIADETLALIERLADSYSAGQAFKEGVPVAIAGRPNAGKSTLLNALLGHDKAIVSDVPGTTRDVIDDTAEIDGILFRFFDTAGLRSTDDTVERIGIDRAFATIAKAVIVLWIVDSNVSEEDLNAQFDEIESQISRFPDKKHLILLNKSDENQISETVASTRPNNISISAKTGQGLDLLKSTLCGMSTSEHNPDSELIVTNARHHAALCAAGEALRRGREALDTDLSADFIAQDIRETIHHLSLVTGQVSTDDLLGNIFANFCIGK